MIRVVVRSTDALRLHYIVSLLNEIPDLAVVAEGNRIKADVLVACCDHLTAETTAILRLSAADNKTPVVLVPDEISAAEMLLAFECRIVSVLPRSSVSTERLARAVFAAPTGGFLPSKLVGELVRHFERLNVPRRTRG